MEKACPRNDSIIPWHVIVLIKIFFTARSRVASLHDVDVKKMQLAHTECTDASIPRASASVVEVLQTLTHELSAIVQSVEQMRTIVQSVEQIASNNARRLEVLDQNVQANGQQLEAIDTRLSESLELIAKKLDKQQQILQRGSLPAPPDSVLNRYRDSAKFAAAVVAVLLLSRRKIRQILSRALKRVPYSLLLLTQSSAGGFLLYHKGLDLMAPLLSKRSFSLEAVTLRERRRLLAYAVLLASTSCLPAKACMSLVVTAARR